MKSVALKIGFAVDDPNLLEYTKSVYTHIVDDPFANYNNIPEDMVPDIIRFYIKNVKGSSWYSLYEKFESSADQELRTVYVYGLAGSSELSHLEALLSYTLDDVKTTKIDAENIRI